MRVVNKESGWIGYRLNLLGIRVWPDGCQLSAKTSPTEWKTLGPKRAFPVHVPKNDTELKAVGDDALLGTIYQYLAAYPHSDLAELLAGRKEFHLAINE